VYLVRHRTSNFISAIEVFYKEDFTKQCSEKLVRREIEIHSNLQHPGILRFYNWFHDSTRIFLLIEYAPKGELHKLLQQKGSFPEPEAARCIAQITQAVKYLHSKHIMHRDIDPENIVLGVHNELKLSDFGFSVYSASDRRDTVCDTLDYLPPEMLKPGKPLYTHSIDLWTLGVLMYELLTGQAPFEDTKVGTQRRIAEIDMRPLPESISTDAKELVCLVKLKATLNSVYHILINFCLLVISSEPPEATVA